MARQNKTYKDGLYRAMLKLLGLVLLLLTFSSCQQDERMLKKFVSRLNAREYNASSVYIYGEDQSQLAFFTKEVMGKNKHAFLKVDECDYDNDRKSLSVNFKWKNANETLRNYFKNIGHPLAEDGSIAETLKVVETTDGDKLSFNWGLPHTTGNNLLMAGVHSESNGIKSVNIRKTPNGKVIGELRKDNKILADKSDIQGGSYSVYWVDDNGNISQGFIKAKLLNLTEEPYFNIGIFDSIGLFVALIIAVVILLPLFWIKSLFSNPALALIGIGLFLTCLYIFYQCVEKIVFDLFLINLPY